MKLNGLQDAVFIEKCFSVSDTDKDGLINFKEVATCLSVLLRGNESAMDEFEFRLWDSDGDGVLKKNEFIEFYMHVSRLDPELKSFDDEKILSQAEKVFYAVDVKKLGAIDLDEFKQAIEHHSLLLSEKMYEILHDPLQTKLTEQELQAFHPEERALMMFLGEKVAFNEGETIPDKAKTIDGEEYECFYVVLEGSVEAFHEGLGLNASVTPGEDAFFHEESVFIKGIATSLSARALSNCTLLRIAATDFMQSYLQEAGGAATIWNRLKGRMTDQVTREQALSPKDTHYADLALWKMQYLQSSGKVLTKKNINQNLVEMQYAVRGLVPITAERIQKEILNGDTSKPFKEVPRDDFELLPSCPGLFDLFSHQVLYCNIGNPHSVGQKPITFYREV